MKKILLTTIIFLASTGVAFAAPSSVNRITDHIEPLITSDYIKGSYFVATSTTATSTFTWGIEANRLKLTNPLEPAFGGTGFSSYTVGDMFYADTTTSLKKIAPNTDSGIKFLSQGGTGTGALEPSWQTVPAQGAYTYYLTNSTSSAGYLVMENATTSETLFTKAITDVSTDQLVQSWITVSGKPDLTNIPAGIWRLHVDATKSSGTKDLALYFKVYKLTGTTETLLFTTQNSNYITGTDTSNPQEFDIEEAQSSITLLSTDRIIAKIFATSTGLGTNPSGVLYYFNNTLSRVEFPSNTISADNFVPYVGATKNLNLGTFNASSTQFTTTDAWITKLRNLTSNGFVKTSSSDGTLSVDTNTYLTGSGAGVTAVSVASSNGFTGSSSGGATPALTLTTSINGILKGNGTALQMATYGTDYGTISTSSTVTAGQLAYITQASNPVRISSLATTTLTATSPLTLSQAIRVIGSSASAISLDDAGVTYAKIQNLNYGEIIGRNTTGAGVSTGLSTSTYKSMLALTKTDVGLPNVANTAQVTSVSGTYPIISSGGTTPTISSALSTTTTNTWSLLNTFANATTTLLSASYASSTLYFGAGLPTGCDPTSGKLLWADGRFSCGTDGGGGTTGGSAGMVASWVNATTLTSTSTPTVTSIVATSTTATSTFMGKVRANSAIIPIEYFVTNSSNVNINWGNGNKQLLQMSTGGVTITFSNYVAGQDLRLTVCNDSNTAGAITWSGTVEWVGGIAPGQTTTAYWCDVWNFTATRGGGDGTTPYVFGTLISAFNLTP